MIASIRAIPKQAAKTLDLEAIVDTRVANSPTKNHPQQVLVVDTDADLSL